MVHSRALTTKTKHVTLAATVMASGKMLPTFLIFKGKPQGCIALANLERTQMRENMHAKRRHGWMNPK
jgi:hypothetical protein